jgi:hypothetical protein
MPFRPISPVLIASLVCQSPKPRQTLDRVDNLPRATEPGNRAVVFSRIFSRLGPGLESAKRL